MIYGCLRTAKLGLEVSQQIRERRVKKLQEMQKTTATSQANFLPRDLFSLKDTSPVGMRNIDDDSRF